MRSITVVFVVALLVGLTWLLLPWSNSTGGAQAPGIAPNASTIHNVGLLDIGDIDTALLENGEVKERGVLAEESLEATTYVGPVALGLVLDAATRKPIQGAKIELSRPLHKEFNCLDIARNEDSVRVAFTVSDSEGRFRMDAPADVPLDLTVQEKDHATAHRAFVFADDAITVLLQPGAIFEGRITRKSTDEPLAGVKLRGWNKARTHAIQGETDIGGNFRFEGLVAELLTVAVTPVQYAAPNWVSIDLIAGQTTQRDFALEEGVAIFGIVTDKRTGLPIVGAEVGEGWVFRRFAVTDSQGHYRLPGFGGPGVYDVYARAPGYGQARSNPGPGENEVPAKDTELDFALDPANGATGRVTDSTGKAIQGVYCAAIASMWLDGEQNTDYESCDSDVDGRFAFHSLNPRLPHQVSLRAPGYGVRTYDFPSPELGIIDLGTFVLHKSGAVRGSVVDSQGQPMAAVGIALVGTNADVSVRRQRASKPHTTSYTSVRDSQTDSAGRFHFADVAGGSYKLRTKLHGNYKVLATAALELAEGEISESTVLILDTGASLSGRALGPDSQPLISARIRAWPVSSPSVEGVTTSTGSNGTFSILGLDPGEYFLRLDVRSTNSKKNSELMASAAPIRVTAGESELILYALESASLRIKLLDAEGQPHPEGFVQVFEPDTEVLLDQGWSDADGLFTVPVRPNGQFDIKWSPSMRRRQSAPPTDNSPDILLNHVSPGHQEHVLKHL